MQRLCQQLSTFGMHDFNEGIEVLQSIAHIWEKGKKVVVGEAAGIISVRDCYVFLRVYVCTHCTHIHTCKCFGNICQIFVCSSILVVGILQGFIQRSGGGGALEI